MTRKFHLMAGRTFYFEGRPAFDIRRCQNPHSGVGPLDPHEVDAIARRVAWHLDRPCPLCNDDPRGLSRSRAVRLKVGNEAMKCPLCP